VTKFFLPLFFRIKRIMATIILDYNTRNAQAQKALENMLVQGIFKVHTIGRPRRKNSIITHAETHNDPFAEVRGIWADRDVDARALRNEAWKISTD